MTSRNKQITEYAMKSRNKRTIEEDIEFITSLMNMRLSRLNDSVAINSLEDVEFCIMELEGLTRLLRGLRDRLEQRER